MNPVDREKLRLELVRDEGLKLQPYKDTVGKLTIGIGRNLSDKGISEEEAYHLLENDIDEVLASLDKKLPWWRELDSVRQRVLANMAFNMGIATLLTFKQTLKAIKEKRWVDAADGMAQSKWANQVGKRAARLIRMMETGQ